MTPRWRVDRSGRDLDRQLPLVAATMARSVRAGASLATALRDAASSIGDPASIELARVLAAVDRGVPLAGALDRWRRSRRSEQLDLLVVAARMGHQEGGDLAAALEGAAAALLDRIEVADEARALSAQATSSAMALVALPPFGAACFVLLDPGVGATLFGSIPGWACLVVGSLLDAAGAALMLRMVRAATA